MTMDHAKWLEERRKSIGGSDAAAIVGLNEWASPFSVWADKTGRLPDKPDTEAMRQGRDLEQYVADRWMEATGKKCRRRTQILKNSGYPFAHANVDRWVVGENAGLECKTTQTFHLRQFKGGEYPDRYYVQCVHYMAVTGAARWYLAVLVLGSGFFTFTIERDEEEISALMAAEEAFWHYVESDTPPPVDGTVATTETLKTIYRDEGPGDVIALLGYESVFEQLALRKQRLKEAEALVAEAENQIKAALGENECGACGRYQATWKAQSRRTFDVKAFAKANPEFSLEPYYKTSQSRVFRVKEQKEES